MKYGMIFSVALGLALMSTAASARSGGLKYAPDYSDIRGFNYNTASSLNTQDEWLHYNHAEVDRDFGYAERLKLNSVRVFLSYKAWAADKAKFRANLRDFVRTAAAHHGPCASAAPPAKLHDRSKRARCRQHAAAAKSAAGAGGAAALSRASGAVGPRADP